MRWKILVGLCMLSCTGVAQVLSDSLVIEERRFGYSIYQGPLEAGPNRISVLMKNCPNGLSLYNQGKQLESFGLMFGAIGLVTAGAATGNYFFNGKAKEQALLILPGMLVLGAAIPLYYSGGRKVKSGITYYNQNCLK